MCVAVTPADLAKDDVVRTKLASLAAVEGAFVLGNECFYFERCRSEVEADR